MKGARQSLKRKLLYLLCIEYSYGYQRLAILYYSCCAMSRDYRHQFPKGKNRLVTGTQSHESFNIHYFHHTTMQFSATLTELSRNNELVSEEKLQEAIELLSQANAELLLIDTEIQRLKAKREQVQGSIDIYNTILSPARRLPPDILREIFHQCLTIGRPYPILSATEAPMLLTRICSLWRSIALSSPWIWTRLHIPLPGDPRLSSKYGKLEDQALDVRRRVFSKTMQLRCQAVKEWLGRSGSCPLSLSISYPFGYISGIGGAYINGAEDDEVADPLFQIICPFAPRWGHLDLSMPFNIYQKLETRLPFDSLSMLRGFKGNIFFEDYTSPGSAEPTMVPLHIIELPTLETLSINCQQLTINLGRYQNSWDRLTDICFESPVLDRDLLEMLKQCHKLIKLDVNMQVPWDRMPDAFEPALEMVLLPHLESLNLHESGPFSAVSSAVDAPSLKSLQYRCPHRYGNYGTASEVSSLAPPKSLIWLISNAAASLETLSIDPRTLQSEHVLQCLRLAAHVKELKIGDSPFWPPMAMEHEEDIRYDDYFDLEVFTVPIATTEYEPSTSMLLQKDILLPNLESLEANDGYIIADENIRRMLTSRIDAAQRGLTSPLGRVKIHFGRQKGEDLVPEIVARARDVGIAMKLELVYQLPGLPYIGRLSPSFLLPDQYTG